MTARSGGHGQDLPPMPTTSATGGAVAGLQRLIRGVLAARRGDSAAAREEWLAGLSENPKPRAEVALG